MNQAALWRIATFVIFTALISACAQETKTPAAKFTGRVLLLMGEAANGANLTELTPTDSGPNLSTITGGVLEAVPSPDQTRLLYATKDEVMLRDLHSGVVKSLIKGENFCLAWSTDGNHFSYKQRSAAGATKLYEADLNGQSKLVLEDPNGSTDCARWIASDRLVFDRFVGTQQKTKPGELKPNTTTIATVGDAVKLHDTQRKWSIESVCPKDNNAFLRAADQGTLLIAKNIDHFETLDPSPAPCSECRFVGYAAQSCVPFFIEQPTSTTTELFYLNPTNWQKQRPGSINRTFSLNARMLVKSSARLMIVGDAGSLFLIDTESGEITSLLAASSSSPDNGRAGNGPVPIVWIEK
ncbi:MAG: hypothetical protein ABR607_07995 [Pyrinomonadaceae bacterium]